MTWIAIAVAVAFLAYFIIDDEHAELLIAIGAIILISGMFSEFVNEWLKVVGCRPRYRYLITLDDPKSEYRNWWEMRPYIADESNFRSWPSGHMTRSVMMLTLPMIVDGLKCRKRAVKYVLFSVALLFIILLGYNRIHTNAHFLTDVCFGSLFALSIYGLTYKLVFSSVKH
jgi:membrane-associated phospholipid phosphatase